MTARDQRWPCGGTGRRARLKIEFRKEYWLNSGQGHQLPRAQISGYGCCMTKLLEKAIAQIRELPAEDQDAVAVAMLAMMRHLQLSPSMMRPGRRSAKALSKRGAGSSLRTLKSKHSGNGTVCEGSFHARARNDLAAILQYIDERSPRHAEHEACHSRDDPAHRRISRGWSACGRAKNEGPASRPLPILDLLEH